MDNLTHTLFAATLARTGLGRAGRGTTAALLVASNAPDIDAVSLAGGQMSYIHWHRGPTHGILGVVCLGLATAAAVSLAYRLADARKPERPREQIASFGMLVGVSIVAVALHVLMDLPTSYGTRLFSPFDWHWYAFDWLPIIDVYLLAALAIGLILGGIGEAAPGGGARRTSSSPAPRRRMATVVLILMGVNYGLRATAHHEALVEAPRLFGPLLPPACDPSAPAAQRGLAVWPLKQLFERRDAATDDSGSVDRATDRGPLQRPCLVELAAVPTFTSPFRWRLVVRLSNAYELHELDLLDRHQGDDGATDRLWRVSLRVPDQWTAATRTAAAAPMARTFLGFSRFPAARAFKDQSGGSTVRWSDVRFVGGFLSLEERTRRPDPFNLTVRLDLSGRVIEERPGRQ